MPRKLPWQTGSSTTVARPKRPFLPSTSTSKRQKILKDLSDSEGEDVGSSGRKERANKERPASSSPPPNPPQESFMKEGTDCDDKYRMVEDEFLTIAQRFTVHLHAAEYKRLQKMAKTRNADTISSISRPVTGRMPDQTKRKVEAIARSKTKKLVLESLIRKNSRGTDLSDDSDDGDGLPYVGTSLHGLMDSPKRKAASLTKLSAAVTTRASAGYKRPVSRSDQKSSLGSPQPRQVIPSSRSAEGKDDDATESSVDDDDLDAFVPAKPVAAQKTSSALLKELQRSNMREPYADPPRPKPSVSGLKNPGGTVKTELNPMAMLSPPRPRIRYSRLEQARAQRAKEEKEQQAKKQLDIIPTFL
ncbi:hypothetical protein EG329_003071 [Mollisiaceae sp. DMI_Dod_QoI]|nr:hypothetical protein EG329_003071 [Helotiales sp. DMI_Dod_QoI]